MAQEYPGQTLNATALVYEVKRRKVAISGWGVILLKFSGIIPGRDWSQERRGCQ